MNIESFDSLHFDSKVRAVRGQRFKKKLGELWKKKTLKCHFELKFNNFQIYQYTKDLFIWMLHHSHH